VNSEYSATAYHEMSYLLATILILSEALRGQTGEKREAGQSQFRLPGG